MFLKRGTSTPCCTITDTLSLEELEKQCKGKVSDGYVEGLSPKTMLDYCEKRIQGQGIQLKLAVYQIYRYMQSVEKGDSFCADNWILTAPSGSGKTEFYRTIKELFARYNIPIPVVQIDLSQITEADKKCVPSYGSNNVDNNAAVQANLLTLIEGTELKVDVNDEQKDFDSTHTMFVLMGAFQSIRQQKQEKRASKPLGFTASYAASSEDNIDRVEDCFYEDLTLQDMIDYGMREELAGRMVQVVNFHKLSEEAMLELLRYKVEEISDGMGIDIGMTENSTAAGTGWSLIPWTPRILSGVYIRRSMTAEGDIFPLFFHI